MRWAPMPEPQLVRIIVNGSVHEVAIEPRRTLADVLRHDLDYTGTHVGCEHGVCGACTVIVDGVAVRSCLMFGVQADDCQVETVEGLDDNGSLNSLQDAFAEHHALQCGFCTPGFLLLATALLRERAIVKSCGLGVEEESGGDLLVCRGFVVGDLDSVLERRSVE